MINRESPMTKKRTWPDMLFASALFESRATNSHVLSIGKPPEDDPPAFANRWIGG
jgi:hypothetical protein